MICRICRRNSSRSARSQTSHSTSSGEIVKPHFAVFYVVALGKRKLLWDLLPDAVEENVVRFKG